MDGILIKDHHKKNLFLNSFLKQHPNTTIFDVNLHTTWHLDQWNNKQQKQLELGIISAKEKQFNTSKEKWIFISNFVDNKDLTDCNTRFKKIRQYLISRSKIQIIEEKDYHKYKNLFNLVKKYHLVHWKDYQSFDGISIIFGIEEFLTLDLDFVEFIDSIKEEYYLVDSNFNWSINFKKLAQVFSQTTQQDLSINNLKQDYWSNNKITNKGAKDQRICQNLVLYTLKRLNKIFKNKNQKKLDTFLAKIKLTNINVSIGFDTFINNWLGFC